MTSLQNSDRPQKLPGMRGLSDEDCLVLARNGNRAAHEEIAGRYVPVVYRLCLRLLGDRDSAGDVTQEVFVRALGAMDRFDSSGSLRAWLCTIAWNAVRDRHRSMKIRGAVVADDRGDPFDRADPKQRTPQDLLEREEEAELVGKALDRLDPRTRAILVLRDVEGLSYGELAHFLECRIGTVKSRIHRARRELKDVMLRLCPGWFES